MTSSAREPIEVFGPSPETYALVVLAALPLATMIGPWLRGYQRTRDLLVATGVALFALYAVRAFQLSLSPNGVRYRSPFGRPPVIRWSSITRVRTGAQSTRKYPLYFMEIVSADLDRPLVINIKFFSRKALRRLAALLVQHAAQAHLDHATQDLAKGEVPSMFFRTGGDEGSGS
jgi:hypothetical protein